MRLYIVIINMPPRLGTYLPMPVSYQGVTSDSEEGKTDPIWTFKLNSLIYLKENKQNVRNCRACSVSIHLISLWGL